MFKGAVLFLSWLVLPSFDGNKWKEGKQWRRQGLIGSKESLGPELNHNLCGVDCVSSTSTLNANCNQNVAVTEMLVFYPSIILSTLYLNGVCAIFWPAPSSLCLLFTPLKAGTLTWKQFKLPHLSSHYKWQFPLWLEIWKATHDKKCIHEFLYLAIEKTCMKVQPAFHLHIIIHHMKWDSSNLITTMRKNLLHHWLQINVGNQSFGKSCAIQFNVSFCGELRSQSRNVFIAPNVYGCVCFCMCGILKMQSLSSQLLFGAKISHLVPTTANIEGLKGEWIREERREWKQTERKTEREIWEWGREGRVERWWN